MGNCQAAEAAAAAAAAEASASVIRHPDGRVERVYWSLTSGQLMASNPGHYVGVVISARSSSLGSAAQADPVRYLKLLRPDDGLLAGHVHWLVSFEDVLKEFGSKKHVRLSRLLAKQEERHSGRGELMDDYSNSEDSTALEDQGERMHEKEERRALGSNNRMLTCSRWSPTLQSIAEIGTF